MLFRNPPDVRNLEMWTPLGPIESVRGEIIHVYTALGPNEVSSIEEVS